MKRIWTGLIAAGCFLGIVGFVRAQSPPDISAYLNKTELTPKEKDVVQKWIRYHARALAAEPQVERQIRHRDRLLLTRKKMSVTGMNHSRFSPAFVQFFNRAAAKEVGKLLSPKKRINLVNRINLIVVLAKLQELTGIKTLASQLKQKEPALRYWAATGLVALRAKMILTGQKEKIKPALAALVRAGSKETQTQILRAIYAALELPGSVEAADAFAKLLKVRLAKYKTGSPQAVAADTQAARAVRIFCAGSNMLPKKKQNQLIGLLGRLMAYAGWRYALDFETLSRSNREQLAMVVRLSEDVLVGLVNVPGRPITDQLKKGDLTVMRAEILNWVGGPGLTTYRLKRLGIPPLAPLKPIES